MGNSFLNCNNVDICADAEIKCQEVCDNCNKSKNSGGNPQSNEKPQAIQFSDVGSYKQEGKPPESADRMVSFGRYDGSSSAQAEENQNALSSSFDSETSSQPETEAEKDKFAISAFDVVVKSQDKVFMVNGTTGQTTQNPQIAIPFEVLKMYLSTSFIPFILKYFPDFLNDNQTNQKQWTTLSEGIFFHEKGHNFGTIIQNNKFYEGYFIKKIEQNAKQTIVPHIKGIFITKQYCYEGELHQGYPNGKGCFQSHLEQQESFQGTWENGNKKFGTLSSRKFQYWGDFKDNVAHGNGQIQWKDEQIFYKGKFRFGKFEDKLGFYDCREYFYKGGFKEGKRNGEGLILMKEQMIKKQGIWEEDKLKRAE